MEYRETIQLPAAHLYGPREVTHDYTLHGDTYIRIKELASIETRATTFNFSHGSELTLIASMLGFCHRAGMPETEVKEILADMSAEIDPLEYDHKYKRELTALRLRNTLRIARGERGNRYFDNEFNNWTALCTPISHQPGVIDIVGGVGVYSRTDVFGVASMVLSRIIPPRYVGMEEPVTAELYLPDILPVGRMICNQTLGEYRQDIAELVDVMLNPMTE